MRWEMVKLGDVCKIFGGGTPDRSNSKFWGGSIPWVTVKDFKSQAISSSQESITELGLQSSSSNMVKAGTIIVPTRMALGKAAITTVDVAINQDLKAITIKDDSVLHRDYLLYFLISNANYIESFGKGATVKGITLDVLLDLQIPLPPLATQKRIAEILDKADALRRKDRELLEKYDALAQSVFVDMFGDPVKNEKGWEVKKLGECISEIVAGDSFGGEERQLKVNEMGVLKVSAVTSGVFRADQYKAIDKKIINKNVVTLKKGDLLFSRANTRDLVGATCIVDQDYDHLFLPDKIWRLDLESTILDNCFTKFLLSDKKIRYELNKTATGTSGSMLNISMQKLKELQVPNPPIKLQIEFQKTINNLNDQTKYLNSSASESLFQTLLQKAFAGELVK